VRDGHICGQGASVLVLPHFFRLVDESRYHVLCRWKSI
jgi:hypothetical protein